ncbi:hypothetical protein PPUJ20066_24670 [Pseudomonas putida]|nr:hypothetical protein PPUJ20066_24670 [Pseudomonas putida]
MLAELAHSRGKPAPTGLSPNLKAVGFLWERACPANGPSLPPNQPARGRSANTASISPNTAGSSKVDGGT